MEKKLHKSVKDKKLAGVCGGLAEYFGIDPTIIRIIWAMAVLLKGAGLLLYIVCALILPEGDGNEPQVYVNKNENSTQGRKVVDVDAEEK